MAPIVILNTALTVSIIEGIQMLAEQFKQKRYEEGRRDMAEKWQAWNNRRIAAEKEGTDFNEPPPSLDDSKA